MWPSVACCVLLSAACGAAQQSADTRAPRVCPTGDAVVQVDQEASALADCTRMTGDLAVGPSFALRSLGPLARVERVAGRIDISGNLELGGVFLPALAAVDGDLLIESNRQVTTVSLHRLVEVKGDLVVRDNRELLRLDLSALRRVGGRLEVSGHAALETAALDHLERAGELVLEDNPAWPAEEVDAIERRVKPR